MQLIQRNLFWRQETRMETIELMKEIEGVIEKLGGWPKAFLAAQA